MGLSAHKKTPKGFNRSGLSAAHCSQLGDGNLGGFHEGNHFTAHDQFQLFNRARGDHGRHDAGRGLNVDFRQHRASRISLMVPLNWLRTLMALIVMMIFPVWG